MENAETLPEYRSLLKAKLDDCLVRKDDPDPKKAFARRGVTREIFEKDRLEHLFGLLFQGENIIAAHDDSDDPAHIANTIRGSEDSVKFCNVLATLLYSKCTDESLRKFARAVLRAELRKPISDDNLPLSQQAARDTFGNDDGPSFWKDQYVFCPVVLKEMDESIYVGDNASCPMPFFEEPVEIGRGAYASVRKVIIEKGHLVNERHKYSNDRNEYAQKEYLGYHAQARKDFAAEMATMTRLIQSSKRHENILTTKASLEWGNTYSLFFDLAKKDLWQYFTDTNIAIHSLDQKAIVFGRTIGLAGALAYLHEELYLKSTNEQLQCYHLDLKPQNILVFEMDGNDIWKISDFGISRFKTVPHGRPESASEHFLDKVFKPRKNTDPSSGIENARFGGTYAAPEAREISDMVTRKSDVWSLGCVIALVMTFLESQSSGIHEFQAARQENRKHDWFFDSEYRKSDSDLGQILHSSVSDWLDALTGKASKRDKAEGTAIQKASTLLQEKTLVRDQAQRLSAKEVERELRDIQSCFTDPALSLQTSDASHMPKHKRRIPHPHWPFHKQGTNKSWDEWHFELTKMVKRCKFSPDGNHLAVVSNDLIAIKSTADIKFNRSGYTHESQNEKSWADFSLGSKYLCVTRDSNHFECSFLPFSTGNVSDVSHIEKDSEPPIRRVAVSPNDETVAFLHEYHQEGRKSLGVALYHIQDLLCQATSSTTSYSVYTGSDESKVSHTFDAGEDPSQKPIIRQPQVFDLPPTDGLVDLKFCSTGKMLVAVTSPYRKEGGQTMQYSIMTWDATNGRLVSCIESSNEGSDDMGDSWKVASLANFASQPSFVTISRKRIHLGTYDSPKYDEFSCIMSDQLLDVLVDEYGDDNRLILIGKSAWRGKSHAFKIPVDRVRDLESLGHGTPTGVDQYDALRDACCIQERSEGRVLLVASMDTRRQKGKLCEISFD